MDGSGDPRQSDPLREALTEYMSIPGMEAALLVSDQGLVISGVARAELTQPPSPPWRSIAELSSALGCMCRLGSGTMRVEFEARGGSGAVCA